jgi:hypothetical protein
MCKVGAQFQMVCCVGARLAPKQSMVGQTTPLADKGCSASAPLSLGLLTPSMEELGLSLCILKLQECV